MHNYILSALIASVVLTGCHTSASFILPPNTDLMINGEHVTFKSNDEEGRPKYETTTFFWTSLTGIDYSLMQNDKIIKSGRLPSHYKKPYLFGALYVDIFFPFVFDYDCYDLTDLNKNFVERCAVNEIKTIKSPLPDKTVSIMFKPPLKAEDMIRVNYYKWGGNYIFIVKEIFPDSMVVQPVYEFDSTSKKGPSNGEASLIKQVETKIISYEDIERFEVRVPRSPRQGAINAAWKGAALLSIAAGGVAVALSGSELGIILAVPGALIGSLVGAFIGAEYPGERWEDVTYSKHQDDR